MANVGRTGRAGERTLTYDSIVQDFVPSSDWCEDSNGHYLLVDLPGFKKEEVRLQIDTSGNIKVSGERLRSDNKHIIQFEQICTMPPDSDIDKISGKFDGELLYVTVPKRKEETKQPEPEPEAQIHNDNINSIAEDNNQETVHRSEENVVNKDDEKGSDNGHANQYENKEKEKRENDSWIDSFGVDFLRKWGQEPSQFERAIRTLQKNKGIVITALLAFSLGVFVTRKFRSAGQGEAV